MELFIVILLVIFGAIVISLFTKDKKKFKNKSAQIRKMSFKEIVQQTFPKYRIIEKNQQIMICEYNHRNEPEELVFIRLSNKKSIKKLGRMLIVEYSKLPTPKEMKADFESHLN